MPRGAVARFGLTRLPGWPPGCVQGPSDYGLRVVVLRDLPRVRRTSLLRLLGAGPALREALAELARLPTDARERVIAVPELIARRMEMPQDAEQLTREERDFQMSTHELYEQWKREVENAGVKQGVQQGVQQGLQRGLQQGLIAAYEARFGAVPRALAAAIGSTPDPEKLRAWFGLVWTRSQEEIAAGLLGPRRARGHRAGRRAR